MNGRKAVYVVYLDLSKAFYIISDNIVLDKLAAQGLDGGTLGGVKNCGWLGQERDAERSYVHLGLVTARVPQGSV